MPRFSFITTLAAVCLAAFSAFAQEPAHTWMIYVPGQLSFLNLPDVASLNATQPLMVINCLQDQFFTMEGMKSAETKLAAIYGRMQADAIAWLERWFAK
jgi:hypothetical protein